MQGSVLSVRVEPEVKEAFASLCEELGMTASVAVNVFVRQMIRDQALPFVPSALRGTHPADARVEQEGVPSLPEIASSVGRVVGEYPEVKRVTLFGSCARGEATAQSDVDLRVELADGASLGLFALSGLASKLEDDLGRHVDVVTANDLDSELEVAIGREGVVVYER